MRFEDNGMIKKYSTAYTKLKEKFDSGIRYLSLTEASELCGVSNTFLYHYEQRGELVYEKVYSKYKFSVSSLLNFFASRMDYYMEKKKAKTLDKKTK